MAHASVRIRILFVPPKVKLLYSAEVFGRPNETVRASIPLPQRPLGE